MPYQGYMTAGVCSHPTFRLHLVDDAPQTCPSISADFNAKSLAFSLTRVAEASSVAGDKVIRVERQLHGEGRNRNPGVSKELCASLHSESPPSMGREVYRKRAGDFHQDCKKLEKVRGSVDAWAWNREWVTPRCGETVLRHEGPVAPSLRSPSSSQTNSYTLL